MPDLRTSTFTDITQKTATIETARTTVNNTMAEWRELWRRMPLEKKKEWLDKGKVGVISKAYALYQELKEDFKEIDDGEL